MSENMKKGELRKKSLFEKLVWDAGRLAVFGVLAVATGAVLFDSASHVFHPPK